MVACAPRLAVWSTVLGRDIHGWLWTSRSSDVPSRAAALWPRVQVTILIASWYLSVVAHCGSLVVVFAAVRWAERSGSLFASGQQQAWLIPTVAGGLVPSLFLVGFLGRPLVRSVAFFAVDGCFWAVHLAGCHMPFTVREREKNHFRVPCAVESSAWHRHSIAHDAVNWSAVVKPRPDAACIGLSDCASPAAAALACPSFAQHMG